MKYLFGSAFALLLFACSPETPPSEKEPSPTKESAIVQVAPDFELAEGEIIYEVTLIDKLTGKELKRPPHSIDWKYRIAFDPENVSIYEKYADENSKNRRISKTRNEVLNLLSELDNNSAYFCSLQELVFTETRSSNPDTTVVESGESKLILGYPCQKMEYQLDNYAKLHFWHTDQIKVGLTLPNGPLATGKIALDFKVIDDHRIIHFEAKTIRPLNPDSSAFEHQIPDDYPLIVSSTLFTRKDQSSNIDGEFRFISYPFFGKSKEAIYAYLETQVGTDPRGESARGMRAYLKLVVEKDGSLTVVSVNANSDEKQLEAQLEQALKKMPKWAPAKVHGVPVRASVHLSL